MASLTSRVVNNARSRGVVVYKRWQWGTLKGPVYWWRVLNKPHSLLDRRPVDTVWQHITVTYDTGTTVASFKKDVRTLERIGYERFKSGVSYNWVIDATKGWVALGQELRAKGTHTVNDKNARTPDGQFLSRDQNAVSIAIAVLGMPGQALSQVAGEALANLIAAHIDEGAVKATFDYLPHSLVAYKDCPTQKVRDLMPGIKRRALSLRK